MTTRTLSLLLLSAVACQKSGGEAAPASSAPVAEAPKASPAVADPHAGLRGGDGPHSGPGGGGGMGGHGGGGGGMGGHGGAGGDMGGGGAGGGETLAVVDGRAALGPFTLKAPEGWDEKPTSSGMRAAQWRLPGEGGADDAELVVYHFGQGGAGGVEANLERWLGQFQQADGSPSKDKATIEQGKVAGQKATTVEVAGRYVAAVRPGAAEKLDKPEWKMLASIVESPAGAYYFKLVGPTKTVDAHGARFRAMLASMRLDAPAAGGGAAAKPGEAGGGW